jgi:hypothetical protein
MVLTCTSSTALFMMQGRLDEAEARFYFRQLCVACSFCHDQGICHRDLKPENLLVDADGNLKISDFGLSNFYEGDAGEENSRANLLHTTCGTPNYVAPEVLEDKGYDGKKSDTWSCGVILYVLLAGFLPFDEPTMNALFRKIQKAQFSFPSWFSPEVRELLGKIMVNDPDTRITLPEILADPWMKIGSMTDDASIFQNANGGTAGASEGGKPSTTAPSQAQVDGALEETADDMEEEAEGEPPAMMNAFDVVSSLNEVGSGMQRLLMATAPQRQEKKKRGSRAPPAKPAAPRMVQSLRDASDRIVSACDAESILGQLTTAVKEILADAETTTSKTALFLKAVSLEKSLGLNVQLFPLGSTGKLHLVQLSRGKGDIIEYKRFFKTLMEHKLVIGLQTGLDKTASKWYNGTQPASAANLKEDTEPPDVMERAARKSLEATSIAPSAGAEA